MTTRWQNGFVIAAAVLAGTACAAVEIDAPAARIRWIIALDITTSISTAGFTIMRDTMLPEIAWASLRMGDEVHLLRIDSDPERNVQVIALERRRSTFDRDVAALHERIRSTIVRPAVYRGGTNLGGVLAYAQRVGRLTGQSRGRAERVIVIYLTDGRLEDAQTPLEAGPWPDNVAVWFWGVERTEVARLSEWVAQQAGVPSTHLTIVRSSDWQMTLGAFARDIGRPLRNTALLGRLRANTIRDTVMADAGGN